MLYMHKYERIIHGQYFVMFGLIWLETEGSRTRKVSENAQECYTIVTVTTRIIHIPTNFWLYVGAAMCIYWNAYMYGMSAQPFICTESNHLELGEWEMERRRAASCEEGTQLVPCTCIAMQFGSSNITIWNVLKFMITRSGKKVERLGELRRSYDFKVQRRFVR